MNVPFVSPQSSTNAATAATATYHCWVDTPHGPVRVVSQRHGDGGWRHLIPSRSNPQVTHHVTVVRNLFPLRGTCGCKGFSVRGTCRHLTIALAAENWLEDALYTIRLRRRRGQSGDDWNAADALEAMITEAQPAPVEVA